MPDITLGSLAVATSQEPGSAGEAVPTARVTVRLANSSKRATYHVVSSLRGLTFDEPRQTLVLWFADQEADGDTVQHEPFPPSVIALPPGASGELKASVPLRLQRLRVPAGGLPIHDSSELSGATKIAVVVAFDRQPPIKESPKRKRVTTAYSPTWGQTVEASFDIDAGAFVAD